jgi:hypothetical protein
MDKDARSNNQRPLYFLCDTRRGCWPGKPQDANLSEICTHTVYIWKVFSPAKVIFAGVGVLLLVRILLNISGSQYNVYISQAAKDVQGGQDNLVDAFERIESFFRRLEIYTEVSPTAEMTDTIVRIMVEVLSILGIATKEIKQGRLSELFIYYEYVTVD